MKKFFTRISNLVVGALVLSGLTYAGVRNSSVTEARSGTRILKTETLRSVKVSEKSNGSIMNVNGFKTMTNELNKRPQKLPGQPVDLYGSVLFSDGDYSKSLYKWPVTTTGNPELVIQGVQALGAFIDNDMYYALLPGDGYYDPASVKVYDMKSGAKLYEWSGMDYTLMNFGIDKDPISGEYYGVFYDSDGYYTELATVTFDGAKPTRTKTIGKLNSGYIWYGFSINSEGEMYGICGEAYDGAYLYKIDRNTAKMTRIGYTSYDPTDNTAACFDRATNTLYWSVSTEGYYDEPAYLTTVNTSTGKATPIYRFPGDERVGGLAISRTTTIAGAPAECENVKVVFTDGSLSGNITLKAPTKLADGSNGSGDLSVKVKANDAEIASVSANWGEDVTIPVTFENPGKYDFSIYAVNAEGDGKTTSVNGVFVGPDAPKAPTATLTYSDSKMIVEWSAVTESVNGGWIDLANLTYDVVRYPRAVNVATGLKTTSFTEDFPEPEEGTRIYYEVYAVNGSYKSAPGVTNEIALGSIIPPYTSEFATSGLDGYTIVDANNDGQKWGIYDNDGEIEARIKYNSDKDMDDWLITPAFKLESGKSYEFKILAHAHSTTFPERIEVKYGSQPTAEAMTTEIIPATEISTKGNKELKGQIIPATTGKYYIGFHGISEADNYYLYINEYSISAGESLPVPQQVTNLKITPAADYSLTSTISFDAPTKDVYDEALTELTKIEVLRGDDVIKTFENPTPGETLECTDALPDLGTYTYTVYAYTEYGKSVAASASAYIGAPLPGTPQNVKIERTDVCGEVLIKWDPVTTDSNGNPMNPDAVTYGIGFPADEGWTISTSGIKGDSYKIQLCAADEQVFSQVAVFAMTQAGVGEGKQAPIIPVGRPYETIFEDFADAKLNHIWGIDRVNGGRWSLSTVEGTTIPPADDNEYVIAMTGSNLDDSADLFSGLVDLSPMTYPGISFKIFNQSTSANGANINEVIVSVKAADAPTFIPVLHKKVEQLANPKSWNTVNVDLSEYADKVVQVMFTVIVKQYSTTVLDDIYVGPTEVVLPVPGEFTVTNENDHMALKWEKPVFDSNSPLKEEMLLGYKVYRDDELLTPEYITETNFNDNTVEPRATYQYYVTAVYPTGDSDPSEKITVTFDVELPAPTDFTATLAGTQAHLEWSKPVFEEGSAVKESALTGYYIYRNNTLLTTDPVTGLSYDDASIVPDEEYEYYVTALYTYGESDPSDKSSIVLSSVSLTETGANVSATRESIIVSNAEGFSVIVAAANGTIVYRGAGENRSVIRVTPGVYIVSVGNRICKVVIN